MGANINTVKTQVFEIIKKNQSGGYIKTSDFNNYAKLEQLSFYNEVLGMSESSQQTMDIADELKVSVNLFPNSSGLVTKPSDYMQLQSITGRVYLNQTQSKLVQFQVMGQSEADTSEVSGFSRASAKYPIAVVNAGTVEIKPYATFSSVKLNYYRFPLDPIWGFTVSSSREVYDSSTSVDFDIPEQHTERIVQGIVRRFGFSIGNEALVNYK